MSEQLPESAFCAGFYRTATTAESAIDGLLAAGFTEDQIGVIVPKEFEGQFPKRFRREETPAEDSPTRVAEGAAIGAAVGGAALAATALATGGAALIPGAMVLLGGGAIAGGFGNLLISSGYRRGIDEYYAEANDNRQIVVGVYLAGETSVRYHEVAAILRSAGAVALVPRDDPTVAATVAPGTLSERLLTRPNTMEVLR